jgi:hypothetical protein
VLLRAEVDDSRTLRSSYYGTEPIQAIAAVTYTTGAPGWIPAAGPGAPMQSIGVFDSARETAEAVLDTRGWAPGRHTVFVQAQDAAGNVGPATAVFIDIGPALYLPFVDGGKSNE